MKKQLPKRHELPIEHTWDITNLFKSETLYEEAFTLVEQDVDRFTSKYENHLNSIEVLNDALTKFQDIQARLTRIGAYASLQASTDSLSEENQIRHGKAMIRFQSISKKLVFF